MKKFSLAIIVVILLSFIIGNLYFSQLKKLSCFMLNNKSFSYSQYVKEIKEKAQLILEPDNRDYFNDLKKFLYYDILISNNLQVLAKVSNPKYEKMHQVILVDKNDEMLSVGFNEIKQIENMARVDDIKEREFIASIPLGIQVAPGGVLALEYNPVNGGMACVYAKPSGIIKVPLFINNFFKVWKNLNPIK